MKYPSLLLLPALCACILATPLRAIGADNPPPAPETKEHRDARMAWFQEARFGMFIHWGLYSVPAGTYEGKKDGDYAEWLMHDAKIPMAIYSEYARQFDPEQFDAGMWVSLAKQAGMKYIVITAKHHEGFAMFKTEASPFNIVDATPFKRDPIKELAEACRKQDMKLCLYYSQNLDWHQPGGGGGDWDPEHKGDPDAYVDKIVIPQLHEILTHYGEISMIWWDIAGGVINKDRADRIYKTVEEINPNIIMNNRLGGGYAGDTSTPEQTIPAKGLPGRDWEACMTMNHTWGYSSVDQNYKSTQVLLHNLIDIVSKGGNYLLNVGPDSTGVIPGPQVERLKEIGQWMKLNAETVHGTQASPLAYAPAWGRVTKKGDRLFLHVFSWPKDGKLVLAIHNSVKNVHLLAAPDQPLQVAKDDNGLVITLPATAPDPIASVISLGVEGAMDPVPPAPLEPQTDGSYQLKADAADLLSRSERSPRIATEESANETNIGFWTQTNDYAQWQIHVPQSGIYTVSLDYSAFQGADGNKLKVTIGSQTLDFAIKTTGDWNHYQSLNAGTLHIDKAGVVTVRLDPETIKAGTGLCNLRAVILTPAK